MRLSLSPPELQINNFSMRALLKLTRLSVRPTELQINDFLNRSIETVDPSAPEPSRVPNQLIS